MLKKLIRSRRALSPIFATLILLAIVTILFVPVFIWVSGMSGQTENSWQVAGTMASERIVVEEVNLSAQASPQSGTIYVRNIGETVVSINDVLISNSSSQPQVYQKGQISTVKPNSAISMTSVTKGNLIQINIASIASANGFKITNGTTYTIQVFTTRGIGDSYQVKALWFT